MAARRLDGVACAARIREDVAPRVAAFVRDHGRPPGLGVVLAGRNPASEVYVRNKIKTVGNAGCRAELFRLDSLIRWLDSVDGRLKRRPLPATPPAAPGTPSVDVRLTAEARGHYDRAIAAQRAGDWAKYGEEIKALGEVLERMKR